MAAARVQDDDWINGGHRWLMDTDTAWRSTKIDQRVEALLMLPEHLSKTPTPTVLKSAFLKLSEYWRSCTNDIRVILARVICKCARHIASIGDSDEIIRRIIIVVGSNDPCARSLSLLVLGHLSFAIRDRSEIHIRVFKELERTTSREIAAGAYAVDRIWSTQKKITSLGHLNILGELIRHAEVLDDEGNLSLRLAHVLRNSDQDFHQAVNALDMCTALSNQSCTPISIESRSAALQRTIAVLSMQFPAFLPKQIGSMVSVLQNDQSNESQVLDLQESCYGTGTGTLFVYTKVFERGSHPFSEAIDLYGLEAKIVLVLNSIVLAESVLPEYASALLDISQLALIVYNFSSSLTKKQPFESTSFDLAKRILTISTSIPTITVQFRKLIGSVWNLCEIVNAENRHQILDEMIKNKNALIVLASVWSHRSEKHSTLSLSSTISSSLDYSMCQNIDPKHMLIQELLVSGMASSEVIRIDDMLDMIDSPLVLGWIKTIWHMGNANMVLESFSNGGSVVSIKSARLSFEEALTQLYLLDSLGLSRKFQIAYIQLHIKLLRLVQRVRDLWLYLDLKAQGTTIIVSQSLADSCSSHANGSQGFYVGFATQLRKMRVGQVASFVGRQIDQLLKTLDLAPKPSTLESILSVVFALRPTPRFFFNSKTQLQFKLHVTPLPKAGHSLVLRRKTVLVLQLEGFASFESETRHTSAAISDHCRMDARFTVTAHSQNGAQVAQTTTICHIKQPAGYFSTSCSLKTDMLPERFHVSVSSRLESSISADNSILKSWRVADPVRIGIRLVKE
ncbi:hypothetical protein BASA50_001383 [Batrachochytrium salamandrivorans]|uniref:Integrator complex subunit 7 N-terminal domain-containing protein n=1 Tax=Batrachochytrium salamandrivorans TaxID=1357716 RepID=A0ABQ8EYI9_9FUNG|nr:hypothetical protein BASA50_001383 [Batrachochytrium salamandrivorans]